VRLASPPGAPRKQVVAPPPRDGVGNKGVELKVSATGYSQGGEVNARGRQKIGFRRLGSNRVR
jgi:hypothetical protein